MEKKYFIFLPVEAWRGDAHALEVALPDAGSGGGGGGGGVGGGPRQLEGGHHQLDPPHVGHRADLVGAGGASGPGPGGEGGLVDVRVVFTRKIFIIIQHFLKRMNPNCLTRIRKVQK